jgi:hypothetical protein
MLTNLLLYSLSFHFTIPYAHAQKSGRMKCGIKQKICHQSNITEVNARDLNYMGIS